MIGFKQIEFFDHTRNLFVDSGAALISPTIPERTNNNPKMTAKIFLLVGANVTPQWINRVAKCDLHGHAWAAVTELD